MRAWKNATKELIILCINDTLTFYYLQNTREKGHSIEILAPYVNKFHL